MKIIDLILETSDREKRKYLWLAYLKKIDTELQALCLSPSYKEVKELQTELQQFIANCEQLKWDSKWIAGLDLKRLQPIFGTKVSQHEIDYLLNEMKEVFMPHTVQKHDELVALKQFAYSLTEIEPIGIEQLYDKEGYAFVKYKEDKHTKVYHYKISSYANTASRIKVYLQAVMEFYHSFSCSFESVKLELNRKQQLIPYNSYLVQYGIPLPYNATVLPVVKGALYSFLNER